MTILHADSNHPSLLRELAEAGHHNIEAYRESRKEVLENQPRMEGIIIRSRFAIDRDFMDAAPKLKFIARVGAGLENIEVDYARQKGILLFSAPEGNRNAVGEHALGMLLSLMNKMNRADREIREGLWHREENRGNELEGKTVGIIGYGNMGKSFSRKLKGFEVEVICFDILPAVGDEFATQVSLEELFQRADVISLHTPWTASTDKMVNAEFIASFAKPFWFLNTARGKSVVTRDLVNSLRKGDILGAGLDVLEYEKQSFESLFKEEIGLPEPLRELLSMDNVLLSPHVAGWTVESHRKLAHTIAQKIISHFGRGDLDTNPARS